MTSEPVAQPDGLLITDDLFFSSKVTGTAQSLGLKVLVKTPAAALELLNDSDSAISFVMIDLGTPDLNVQQFLEAVQQSPRPKVIAYNAHVHTESLNAARDAGCDDVLSRGQFNSQLPELLTQFVNH
ncbi:MAG: hypothetical protein Tsb009_19860 [Planctomycetaceae bacterium]